MKKTQLTITLTVTLSFFILFSYCNGQESIFNLSAKIENPNSDSLFILNALNGNKIKTFFLNKGELKKDTVNIPMGYYRIGDGTENTLCFLKPNYDLHLTLNTKEFDESINYSGIGENANNYLAAKYLLEERLRSVNNYNYYASLEENEFLNFVDSIYQLKLELFNKHKQNFDEDFLKLEAESLKTQYLTKIAQYIPMHMYITKNNDFKVSNDFVDPFKDNNFDDQQLIIVPGYIDFVNLYIQNITLNLKRQNDSISFYNTYVDLIDSEIPNKIIKEGVAHYFGLHAFNYAEDKEYCYNKLKDMISTPENMKPIEEVYAKIQKIKKGAISPGFEFYDIDSNLVKLEDFRGKLVYIDIWATWCVPCIKEIPYLHELQTELKDKNIVFVSICQRDDRERWKAAVISKKLKGVQLFAGDADNKFFTDYLVTGIPRFILIDENGLIIDARAKQPSYPQLKKQLEELL